MKFWYFVFFCLFVVGSVGMQVGVWYFGQGLKQECIWFGVVFNVFFYLKVEVVVSDWVKVIDVSELIMMCYLFKGCNIGVVVVVFFGGGYQMLVMDLEGIEICDWLIVCGIICVLLKYCVLNFGFIWVDNYCYYLKVQMVLQDV